VTIAGDVTRFRAVVARHLGLGFEEPRFGELADVLERLGGADGGGPEGYLDRLERSAARPEDIQALARHLTVGETYFFRNPAQCRAFSEVALPERLAARSSHRRLRLLSAGCSSGEEPYSMAILARERLVEPGWDASILGVDVNAASLERAARACYSAWALRETSEDVRKRWFRSLGRDHTLDPSIRDAVRFEQRNLADEERDLWLPEAYDVIFCRNVLMYFTPEMAREVVGRLAGALAPGGYLFLGHAETLRGLSQDFHLRHTHETFYYQRKEREALARAEAPPPSREPRREILAVLEATEDASWVEAVRRSTERVRELEGMQGPFTGAPASGAAIVARGSDVHRAVELLANERFADALACLDGQAREAPPDPDTLLLRAVLLTHSGQLEAAETVCAQLRGRDELSAGAHYLLALCREGAGDRTGAVENDQVAAYLDPGFAMPRLHLGLLSRRAGDLPGARRHLEQALALLDREDASRVLLFGGGFTREALMGLCRAELRAAQGEAGGR
jgi:chemotaxis protein methyltransferase CheR